MFRQIDHGQPVSLCREPRCQARTAKNIITKKEKHTTVGIRWWSPTQLLVYRSEACVWQSGRDAQFSSVYGRMYHNLHDPNLCSALAVISVVEIKLGFRVTSKTKRNRELTEHLPVE